MLAGLRLTLQRCATVVLLVSAIAVVMTLDGLSPLNGPFIAEGTRIFLIQAFLATAVSLTLPVSALRHDRAQTPSALSLSEEQHRLLADNSSDLVLRITAGGDADWVCQARPAGCLDCPLRPFTEARWPGASTPRTAPRFTSAVGRARRHGD